MNTEHLTQPNAHDHRSDTRADERVCRQAPVRGRDLAQVRQGDVLLVPVADDLPHDTRALPRVGGRVVLAEGEATGHALAIRGLEYLPAEAPLDAGTEYALCQMGWHHPDPPVAGRNWWRSCAPDPTSHQMGSLAIATLHALGVLNQPLEITLGNEHIQVLR